MTNLPTWATRVHRIRIAAGNGKPVSREWLARRIGCREASVYHWEKELFTPSPVFQDKLRKFEVRFGLESDDYNE